MSLSLVTISSTRGYSHDESTWTVHLPAVSLILSHLKGVSKGSWEYFNVVKPCKAAKKERRPAKIYSAGFSTATVANLLDELGIEYEHI